MWGVVNESTTRLRIVLLAASAIDQTKVIEPVWCHDTTSISDRAARPRVSITLELKDPVFLNYEDVGFGYEGDFCHVSAKHVVEKLGGRRIHGWSLWQFDDPEGKSAPMIVGDFHSVWENSAGIIKDITPPKLGTRILFVRDPTLAIQKADGVQLLHSNRTNDPNFSRTLQWHTYRRGILCYRKRSPVLGSLL